MKRPIAFALVALIVARLVAAQDYLPPSDSRSPQYQEYQRQEREKSDRDKADKQHQEEAAASNAENYRTFMDNQHRLQERLSGQVEEDRAMFLQTPPLPASTNLLLGQWKLDRTKVKTDNPFAEINAALSQPACEMVFGDGIWDFRAKGLWAIDEGFPETMMTEVDYRGSAGLVGVVPKTFMRLLIFKVVNRERVQELTSTRIGADPCSFVRVRSGKQASATPTSAAPASAARAVNAAGSNVPRAPVASTPPPRSTLDRPSPQVCAMTLLDQLGVAGVNQVRAMGDMRFKEPEIDGKEPNTGHMRIDLRGSACDDPRIKATLYDFDAGGILQSVTYVWDRPPGPAPAAIFVERRETLSRFHKLPPPLSPGKLQADISLGRLILQDMPERNLLLEAYKAKKPAAP